MLYSSKMTQDNAQNRIKTARPSQTARPRMCSSHTPHASANANARVTACVTACVNGLANARTTACVTGLATQCTTSAIDHVVYAHPLGDISIRTTVREKRDEFGHLHIISLPYITLLEGK